MTKGYLATLFAAAVSFAGTQAAFAAAPTISPFPDIQIGDMEDNNGGATDNNFFIFTNAFQFSTHVSDADSTAGQMLWSFGEYYDVVNPYSDSTPEFTINGKNPVVVGAVNNFNEETTPTSLSKTANGGAGKINATSDYATFRDILFSPGTGTPPPPFTLSLTAGQIAYSGNTGKNVVLYVADDTQNVAYDIIKVKTKDQGFDLVSSSFTILSDQGLNNGPITGWEQSGLNQTSGDVANSPGGGTAADEADRTDNTNTAYNGTAGSPSGATTTELGTIVRAATGRTRLLGWTNLNSAVTYPGSSSYLRGKVYVYTTNGAADATNKYPPFRARLQQGGAVIGWLNMSYVTTGNTGAGGGDGSISYTAFDDANAETVAGQYLKPSRTASKPSLYRVDFDPVDVPAATARPIIPTFESFAFQDPTAGTIFLTQFTIGAYPALTDAAGTQILAYTRATSAASQGFTLGVAGAGIGSQGFLVENDFTPGYRQHLFLPPPLGTFSTGQAQTTENIGTTGLLVDTGAGNSNYSNRFVVGVGNLDYSNLAQRPRIQANKLYRGRFFGSSDVPTTAAAAATERQAAVRFRLQSAANCVSSYIEFAGPIATSANTSGGPTDNVYKDGVIYGQAAPGINCVNPDTDPTLLPAGYQGGWYTVLMSSPLNMDIRRDVGGTIASAFGSLASQPGPGVNSASKRDIAFGTDVYTTPRNMRLGQLSNTAIPFADANRAKVSITAGKLF